MLIKVAKVRLAQSRNFDEVLKFSPNLTVSEYLELGFTGLYPKPEKKAKAEKLPKTEVKSE